MFRLVGLHYYAAAAAHTSIVVMKIVDKWVLSDRSTVWREEDGSIVLLPSSDGLLIHNIHLTAVDGTGPTQMLW